MALAVVFENKSWTTLKALWVSLQPSCIVPKSNELQKIIYILSLQVKENKPWSHFWMRFWRQNVGVF